MRMEFLSRLALLVVAAFLVVATQVWSGGTLEWLFVAGGVVMLLLAAADYAAPNLLQRGVSGVVGLLGIWSIVEAIVFDNSTLEWVSFGTAVAAGVLAILALAAHEASTERVVHELRVTPGRERTPLAS
jgi:hypothetical protein